MPRIRRHSPETTGQAVVPSVPFVERTRVHIAALVLLSLGLYIASLSNGFVSDDLAQVVNNQSIRDWHQIPQILTHSVWSFKGEGNYYRPFHLLAYMAVYYAFGVEAWPYHLLMLLLHAASVVLVYLIARKWLADWPASLLTGAVFAVHPVLSETVLWVAAVPDALMTLVVLAAAYIFALSDGHPKMRDAVIIGSLYLAALLTKETGAMLLPLLIGCEILLLRRSVRELAMNARLYAVLAGVATLYVLLRLHALGALLPGQATTLTPRQLFFTGTQVAGRYLLKLIVPFGFDFYHPITPVNGPTAVWTISLAACLAVLGIIVFFYYDTFKRDYQTAEAAARTQSSARISFFLFLIAIAIIPALNINAIYGAFFAERYLCLPCVGFALLAGEFWRRLIPRFSPQARTSVRALAFLVLVLACGKVIARVPVWHNDESLYGRAVQESPYDASLHERLATVLEQKGDLANAEREFRAALQLKPSAKLHNSIGAVLSGRGKYAEAESEFRAALGMDPAMALAHQNLAVALQAQGRDQEAQAEYWAELRTNPNSAQAFTGLAMLQYTSKNNSMAAALYRRAIELDGTIFGPHAGLGQLLLEENLYADAAAELQRAVELAPRGNPLLPELHYSLGIAYRNQNMADAAMGEFRAALRLRPGHKEARQQLQEIQQIVQQAAKQKQN